MSDDTQDLATPMPGTDERKILFERAKVMGIKHSPNIGIENLRQKIAEALQNSESVAPLEDPDEESDSEEKPKVARKKLTKDEEFNATRQKIIAEAMKLVRFRLTCMDPSKKDLNGEIFTIANRFLGTVRKFIPYTEASADGWHAPQCIYDHLKSMKYQTIRVVKTPNGRERIITGEAPTFALQELPPLTQAELKQLALQQAAAAGQVEA